MVMALRSCSSRQLLWFLGTAFALIAARPMAAQAVPTVTFSLDFPGSDPSHYAISVSSDRHASYESDGRLAPGSGSGPADASQLTFTASPELSERIFELAKRARYFQGAIDSRKRGLAFTGAKELTYKDSDRNQHAAYNYSPVPAVQELTRIFQNLSATLEFGRRLDYCYRYQKLALDDELKRMEEFAKQGDLQELSAVAPILEKIAADPSVINVVRYRARRLLVQAGKDQSVGQ
jgi:hypothetical protein